MRTPKNQELEHLNHVAEPFVWIWQTNTYWEYQTDIKASEKTKYDVTDCKADRNNEQKQLLEQKKSEKAKRSEAQRFSEAL
jgi:broad specificity polyphosphatase/5'/3'-nucleotidase SurE